MYHWFSANIAFALRDLCDDQPQKLNLDDERIDMFLQGYQTVRPLAPEERARLPLFLHLHHLVSLVKLLHAADLCADDAAPEWAVRLQRRLHQKAHDYRSELAGYPAAAVEC